MPNDGVKTKTEVKMDVYRNEGVADFIAREFGDSHDKSVAWVLFSHLCREYPALRGTLVETTVERFEE